ncbi:MAG: phosphotransacetylase family protein [Cyanobacteria bacterium P01_F01_bin.42]
MDKAANSLLIGSVEASSGKSTLLLGLAQNLTERGLKICFGKPVAQSFVESSLDQDVQVIRKALDLAEDQIKPPIALLSNQSLNEVLTHDGTSMAQKAFENYGPGALEGFGLFEGPATIDEGRLLGLSLAQLAQTLDAPVLLTVRYHNLELVDTILSAQDRLGDRLLGVVLNDVPLKHHETVQSSVVPYLERHQIPVFGLLPHRDLLRSVSVAELVRQLDAEVLCCPNRLNLMVGQLSIGAMNANSALKFFRRGSNMAVVTGGARTDIQLAALESATHCLILTGHVLHNDIMIKRAENLEVPVLSVTLDTLSTVEIIESAFQHARFHESVKVDCIRDLVKETIDTERIAQLLGLSLSTSE